MTAARLTLLAAAGLALATSACIDTDAAVFVEAKVTGPSASLTASSAAGFGARLDGALLLTLHLGPRASGPSQVSLRTFSITNGDQTKTLVDTLPVVFADASQRDPIVVEPDSSVPVPLSFTTGKSLVSADQVTAICGAGGLRIVGALQDSLQTGPTPLTSEVFLPTGCP